MTRFSRKAGDEVPLKHADEARQRTRPADRGCLSPRAISDIYSKGKEYPLGKNAVTHEHQKNQFKEDQHDNGRGRYDNGVARGWLRGSGVEGATARPDFDHSDGRGCGDGKGLNASGQDMTKSPFSAAYLKPNFNRS